MGYNDEIKIFNGILMGNEQILKEFYTKNFIAIKSFIIHNSGTEKDTEDIFQDGLIVLYQKLKSNSLHINCSIHTYFYGICKNIWLRRLRKEHRMACCGKIDDIVLKIKTTIVDDIEQKEREQLYLKYFSTLNCKCKQVLMLFFEGKSMRETAMLLNYSESYVRKKKFECKKYLMEMIEKDPLYTELVIIPETDKTKKEVS